MPNDPTLQHIQEFISNGQTDRALQTLAGFVQGKDRDWESSVIILRGQYNRLESDSRMGVLGSQEQAVTRNRINVSLLSLLNEIAGSNNYNPAPATPTPAPRGALVNTPANPNDPVHIFISYAHEDEAYCTGLLKHLTPMLKKGEISVWTDAELLPGDEWDAEIRKQLDVARIMLFLVSSDFVNSNYIDRVELAKTTDRYLRNEVTLIPVRVRPFDFRSIDLSRFQGLPSGSLPVSKWEDKDEAYLDIVGGLKRVVAKIKGR